MNRISSSEHANASARARSLWQNVSRLSRLPILLGTLWIGLVFSSIPRDAVALAPVQYRIYLSVPDDDPVDVTDTLYTSNGQTYVVYNGPIAVALNYTDDHVYDLNGHPLGFILTIEDGQNP